MKRVFLGGTCNESEWREKLIKLLMVEYFNPVVEDWTEACMEREIAERNTCDFCMYTLTPKMTGVYAVAEVVDDSNKRPAKTILVLLQVDGGHSFTVAQWKSLGAVAKMVSENGGYVFYDLESAANAINMMSEVDSA